MKPKLTKEQKTALKAYDEYALRQEERYLGNVSVTAAGQREVEAKTQKTYQECKRLDTWILNDGKCPEIKQEDMSRYVVIYYADGMTPQLVQAYLLEYYDWSLVEKEHVRMIYTYMIIGDQNGA